MKRIGAAKLEKDAGWVIRKFTYLTLFMNSADLQASKNVSL